MQTTIETLNFTITAGPADFVWEVESEGQEWKGCQPFPEDMFGEEDAFYVLCLALTGPRPDWIPADLYEWAQYAKRQLGWAAESHEATF